MFHVERYFGPEGTPDVLECSTWNTLDGAATAYGAAVPNRTKRRDEPGIFIGDYQFHSFSARTTSTSPSPKKSTSLPLANNLSRDQLIRRACFPIALEQIKSNGSKPLTSSMRLRRTVTFERSSRRATSDKNAAFFAFASIRVVRSFGIAMARGKPGKPAPEPTSASRPSRIFNAEATTRLSPKWNFTI